jgi:hypothetical protein
MMFMLCSGVARVGVYGWVEMLQHHLWRNKYTKEVQISMVNLMLT